MSGACDPGGIDAGSWGDVIGHGHSGAHGGAVGEAGLGPFDDGVFAGVLGGEFLVHINAEAGLVVGVHVAVADVGDAGEDFVDVFGERAPFLDAEVGGPEIEVEVGGVADGRDVVRAVPCGADAIEVSEGGDVSGGGNAAHLTDVHADEVDESGFDEGGPLAGVIEQFTHGNGRGALRADGVEPLEIFGGEGVFEEEEIAGLDGFGEVDGLNGAEAFVDVVEEFDFRADEIADLFDHGHDIADVFTWVEVSAGECAVGPVEVLGFAAVETGLDSDVVIALLAEPADGVGEFFDVPAVGVGIDGSGFAALAAEELVDGHAGQFAFDIPQGHVDTGDGVVEHGAVAPVMMDHHGLPEVFDAGDVSADEHGSEMILDGGVNGAEGLGEGGAAEAVEAGLGGDDLDDDEAGAVGLGEDGLDVGDGDGGGHDRILLRGHELQMRRARSGWHCRLMWPGRGRVRYPMTLAAALEGAPGRMSTDLQSGRLGLAGQ